MDGNRLDKGDEIGFPNHKTGQKKQIFEENLKFLSKKFGSLKNLRTFAIPNEKNGSNAEIAQLVEHNLAKVRVASSSLVFRSKETNLTAKPAQVAEW